MRDFRDGVMLISVLVTLAVRNGVCRVGLLVDDSLPMTREQTYFGRVPRLDRGSMTRLLVVGKVLLSQSGLVSGFDRGRGLAMSRKRTPPILPFEILGRRGTTFITDDGETGQPVLQHNGEVGVALNITDVKTRGAVTLRPRTVTCGTATSSHEDNEMMRVLQVVETAEARTDQNP